MISGLSTDDIIADNDDTSTHGVLMMSLYAVLINDRKSLMC